MVVVTKPRGLWADKCILIAQVDFSSKSVCTRQYGVGCSLSSSLLSTLVDMQDRDLLHNTERITFLVNRTFFFFVCIAFYLGYMKLVMHIISLPGIM